MAFDLDIAVFLLDRDERRLLAALQSTALDEEDVAEAHGFQQPVRPRMRCVCGCGCSRLSAGESSYCRRCQDGICDMDDEEDDDPPTPCSPSAPHPSPGGTNMDNDENPNSCSIVWFVNGEMLDAVRTPLSRRIASMQVVTGRPWAMYQEVSLIPEEGVVDNFPAGLIVPTNANTAKRALATMRGLLSPWHYAVEALDPDMTLELIERGFVLNPDRAGRRAWSLLPLANPTYREGFWTPFDGEPMRVGALVKLVFDCPNGSERMWVQVTRIDQYRQTAHGLLDSDPVLVDAKAGDDIEFRPEHVLCRKEDEKNG